MRQATTALEDRRDPSFDRRSYAEQRLFALSPFNLWITTALIYATAVGAYALAVRIDGAPWLVKAPGGWAIEYPARLALVLPLIVCAALALQRYSRLRELAESEAFARALRPGFTAAASFALPRLRLFTAIGAAVGGLSIVWLAVSAPLALAGRPASFLWFTLIAVILGASFFRGFALTQAGTRHTRRLVQQGLEIDLLRIERLYPFGRVAARFSLIWFGVCAATLLLFASTGFSLFTAGIVVGCALLGLWVFFSTLALVHHRIRREKAAELDRLRAEIAGACARLAEPAQAARLPALLALEARIAAAPEWPFDQTILVRLGASSLILTIPWFGQAIAGAVVQHFGDMGH